jgi:hypothetical protein
MYDINNLAKLGTLGELVPNAFKEFAKFDEAAFKGGVIPLKYKELMAGRGRADDAVSVLYRCTCQEGKESWCHTAGTGRNDDGHSGSVGRRCHNTWYPHAGIKDQPSHGRRPDLPSINRLPN